MRSWWPVLGIVLLIAGVCLWPRRRQLLNFTGGPGGITEVVQADAQYISTRLPELHGHVAAVDKHDGTMYVNVPLIRQMGYSKDQVLYFMLHEAGHMVLGTDDEQAVDEWAQREYLRMGYSPQQSVFALTRVLRFNKEEDHLRSNAALRRAQQYDHENYR